jgi:hypothetical protein
MHCGLVVSRDGCQERRRLALTGWAMFVIGMCPF